MNDERDEPLASEDEIEHEDDSLDVELWKKKLVEWEEQEVIRKAEEERRLQELERQRKEWEERKRQYEEEQRRLYEIRLQEEEELRRQLEAEHANDDLGEEEETWDEELDEYGNPIEDNYDDDMMDGSNVAYNEFGAPREFVGAPGMFSDAGSYRTSVDILGTAFESVKGQTMAADWDDWGETEEMDTYGGHEEPEVPQYASMVSHTVHSYPQQVSISAVSHQVSFCGLWKENVENLDVAEDQCHTSLVAHTVLLQKTSEDVAVSSIVAKLENSKNVPIDIKVVETIAQLDGVNDESSDEDMEQDEDEHRVPDPEVSQPADSDDNDQMEDDDDSIMSVEEVSSGAADNRQRDSKSDSDSEANNEDTRDRSDRDDSSDDDQEDNSNNRNEISNEVGESANYDSHEDSYNSDFDDEVNERNRDSEGSSSDTEGLEQDDVDDGDTKDVAPEVQSDSDIEELEEIEPVENKANEEGDDDQEDDNEDDRSSESESESEFEEEDISGDVPVKQPCILVFDSLGGRKDRQARLCATLRDFLTMEFREKYPGQSRDFTTATIPGCAPKVPQQPNLTDCGIYVCHNVETFFKKPISDFTLPITSLRNWFPGSEPRVKRRDVANLIQKLAREQNKEQLERLIYPDLVFVEPERAAPVAEESRRRSDGESEQEDYISDEEYYSADDDRESEDDRRRKRNRSDISSDEDRSPRRRRRNESDDDDFDSGAVYGAQVDPSPIRRLPPGISVSRGGDNLAPRTAAEHSQSPRVNYPTPLRKLPPGISISRSGQSEGPPPPPARDTRPPPTSAHYGPRSYNPPEEPLLQEVSWSPGTKFVRPQSSRQFTLTSGSSLDEDHGEVTITDVSDCSDDNEIFDLNDPPHTRTYLSPNSFEALQHQQQFFASQRKLQRTSPSYSSMVAHEAATSAIDSCLSSMVAHQVHHHIQEEDQGEDEEMEHVPQIDGMEDFDSEDDHGEAAESVPVNEGVDLGAGEAPAVEDVAAEDINQPEEVAGAQFEAAEEFSLPETTEQHELDVMESVAMEASEVVGVGNIYTEEVPQELSAEEINHLDSGNFPTEVSVGQDLEQLEQMVPTEMGDLIDNNEYLAEGAGENSTDNIVDGDVDTLDNQGNGERYEDEQVEMDDYAQSEDFNEDEEEYNSEVYDEDSRDQQRDYEEDHFRSQYQPPPEKKARMSSEDEVVLDSDDDDGPAAAPAQIPSRPQFPSRGRFQFRI